MYVPLGGTSKVTDAAPLLFVTPLISTIDPLTTAFQDAA
jgi:hypothetical protein